MNFGDTVKYIREIRQINQKDAARGALSRVSISAIENHQQIPRFDKALLLFDNLGVSAAEFNYISHNHHRQPAEDIIYRFEHLSDSTESDRITHLLADTKNWLRRLTTNLSLIFNLF